MNKLLQLGFAVIALISCNANADQHNNSIRVTSPHGSIHIENHPGKTGLSVEELAKLAFGERHSFNTAIFAIPDVVGSIIKDRSRKMELKRDRWDIYEIINGGSIYFYTSHK